MGASKLKRRPPRSRRGQYDRSASAAARRSEQHLKLLDFATQVLAKTGFAETTVEAIVTKAGMSRRTFYEHFVDLRDVLSQVYDRAATVAYTMVSHHSRAEVDPLVQIRSGLAAYFGVVADYPDVARVMFVEYRMAGRDFEARYQADSLRYGAILFESLATAHTRGQITKAPTEATVHVMFKGIEMLAVSRIMRGDHAELPGLVPEVAELILDAFGRTRPT